MQVKNINDFNMLRVMTAGRLEGVRLSDVHLQAAISGLLGSEQ